MTPPAVSPTKQGNTGKKQDEQNASAVRNPRPPKLELWQDKAQKTVDPKLYSSMADQWASFICLEGAITVNREGKEEKIQKKNKQSQLRRFYDEVVRLHDMTERQVNPVSMTLALPALHMLIAKASYALGRNLVTQGFVDLLRDGITAVETKEDLRVFSCFFEAFMAFYKFYDPKN